MLNMLPPPPIIFHLYIPLFMPLDGVVALSSVVFFIPGRRRQHGSADSAAGINAGFSEKSFNVVNVADGFSEYDGFRVGRNRVGQSRSKGSETRVDRSEIISNVQWGVREEETVSSGNYSLSPFLFTHQMSQTPVLSWSMIDIWIQSRLLPSN